MAEVIRINEKTWRIEDGGVRFLLLCGKEKAALLYKFPFAGLLCDLK